MQTVLTPPIFTNYGPLATQYLTGGQMGYMPQAQYLTPAEYGAFRTLPGPTPTGYQNQMPGLLQSWMIRNYGAPFGLPKYTFNTYNPAVNQQQYMSNIRRHSSDQMLPSAVRYWILAYRRWPSALWAVSPAPSPAWPCPVLPSPSSTVSATCVRSRTLPCPGSPADAT